MSLLNSLSLPKKILNEIHLLIPFWLTRFQLLLRLPLALDFFELLLSIIPDLVYCFYPVFTDVIIIASRLLFLAGQVRREASCTG